MPRWKFNELLPKNEERVKEGKNGERKKERKKERKTERKKERKILLQELLLASQFLADTEVECTRIIREVEQELNQLLAAWSAKQL